MTLQSKMDVTYGDVEAALEWYRCAHHMSGCLKSIKQCHSTKRKFLNQMKAFGEMKRGKYIVDKKSLRYYRTRARDKEIEAGEYKSFIKKYCNKGWKTLAAQINVLYSEVDEADGDITYDVVKEWVDDNRAEYEEHLNQISPFNFALWDMVVERYGVVEISRRLKVMSECKKKEK